LEKDRVRKTVGIRRGRIKEEWRKGKKAIIS